MLDGALVRHFRQPSRVGSWSSADPQVGTGWVGDPHQGDVLKLQIRVVDGQIIDTRFKAFGGPWTIAAGSYTAETLVGRSLGGALALDDGEVAAALALPALQIRSAVLAVSACRAAVANFREQPGVDTVSE